MTKLMKGCIRHNPALAATPGSGECASTETLDKNKKNLNNNCFYMLEFQTNIYIFSCGKILRKSFDDDEGDKCLFSIAFVFEKINKYS